MSITAIVLLVLLGIILVLMEFFVVPGITVAGIGGLLLIVGAIFIAYNTRGATTGNYVLLGSLLSLFIALIFSLRSGTWKRIMLDTNVISTITDVPLSEKIKTGDKGITITRISPMGKVMVNDMVVEAKSLEGIINPNTEIEVVKVLNTNIIIKPKTQNS